MPDTDSVHNAVTSYLDEALNQARTSSSAPLSSQTKASDLSKGDLALSSDGEDSDPVVGSENSFVSVGGEVVSDSDLSNG